MTCFVFRAEGLRQFPLTAALPARAFESRASLANRAALQPRGREASSSYCGLVLLSPRGRDGRVSASEGSHHFSTGR